MRREHDFGAELRDPRLEQIELSLGVVIETVDRDHAGNTVVLLHVLDVALQVGEAFFQRLQVLLRDGLEVGAAVVFNCANRRHDHGGRGPQARFAALDVDELLRAEVRAEAGFGDHVIRELHRRARRDHGVAAVRDVGERAAVDEGGIVLERLHEVRLDRVLQEHRHRAMRLEVAGEHGLLVARVADHDLAEALLEIVERGGQAEDRHDLGGDHDVESVLARIAVARAAEAHCDVAQGAVVHVHHSPPRDAPHVDSQFVPVMDVVVEHRREQVVRERDGVEVAGEVQVDVLHGHDLRVAAAGGAAFHAEHRPEGRLAQADHRFLADVIERIAQPHGGGRLALARGRGRHRRHQDQLRVRTRLEPVQVSERHFRLEMPVGLEVLFGNAELRKSDLGNALELGFLCDFDVGGHLRVLLLRDSIVFDFMGETL